MGTPSLQAGWLGSIPTGVLLERVPYSGTQVPEQCGTLLPGPENLQLEDARLQSFWGLVLNNRVSRTAEIVLCVLMDRYPVSISTSGMMVALPWGHEVSTDEPVAGAPHAFTEPLWAPQDAERGCWRRLEDEELLHSEGDGATRKC